MQAPPTPTGEPARSPKNYAKAVILSGLLGFVGLQHFYLGRWWQGLLDVGLTAGWILSFVAGEWLLAIVLLLVDFGHAQAVTIQLLTGRFKDGEGRVVCYPGQTLNAPKEVNPWTLS
jgi:TM2 domain-containing membrane protein YozV